MGRNETTKNLSENKIDTTSLAQNVSTEVDVSEVSKDVGEEISELGQELQSVADEINELASQGIKTDLEAKAQELGYSSFAEAVDAYNKEHGTSYTEESAKEALGQNK